MKPLNISHGFGTRGEELLDNLRTTKQVHGTKILFLDRAQHSTDEGYDILMTDQPSLPVGIKTADCVPILIAEPICGLVAAVHAGWKGTREMVAEKAVLEMARRGGSLDRLIIAIGPAISGRCYEVERDVAEQFQNQYPSSKPVLTRKSEKKWLLDLALVNKLQLVELGLKPEQIDTLPYCTHCHPDLFHSYRRDGADAGRMVSFVQLL